MTPHQVLKDSLSLAGMADRRLHCTTKRDKAHKRKSNPKQSKKQVPKRIQTKTEQKPETEPKPIT